MNYACLYVKSKCVKAKKYIIFYFIIELRMNYACLYVKSKCVKTKKIYYFLFYNRITHELRVPLREK